MKLKVIISKYWPLLVILLIGGSLRLYGLLQNPISLFSDEIDMGYQAYSLIKTGCDYSGHCLPVQFHSFSDVQPPIPIYLIALANLLGVSLELAIRLVPAIFGTLGILMTYLLVENIKSKKIFNIELPWLSLFSAFIVAIVPWHLTYSRIGFSLAMLYFFVAFGLYLYTKFLIEDSKKYLFWSIIVLGLTPMVYNTAKMAIIFYPLLLLLIPGSTKSFLGSGWVKYFSVFLFVPLVVMFLAGGTAARFNYISIFSDPTLSAEVNNLRLLDSGPKAGVGTVTQLYSKIFHNKPVLLTQKLVNNFFGLVSTDFLFVSGDPNLRHSPKNWGMIYKSMLITLILGIYYLIRTKNDKLLFFLLLFIFASLSTSAITSDGFAHASRSFMFLLPLVIISSLGLSYLFQIHKYFFYLLVTLIFIETAFFAHDYWFHYRYDSELSWSVGMKEVILKAQEHQNSPIVISPKSEYPLIFYLFYNRFDPSRFQGFVKNNTLYNNLNGRYNLDGNQIGDTNLYIAVPVDYLNPPAGSLFDANYYLTKLESENSGILSIATVGSVIRLHSGIPHYYEIHY